MEDYGYTVIRLLGQGGCQSRVYEVRNREGKLRVVKQLPWVSEENREQAMREVQLLSSLRHPCIVSYLESFLVRSTPSMPSEDILCLVMGRCERDLRQECLRLRLEWELAQEQGHGHVPAVGGFSDRARFDESQILSWLSQLCWGLQHLHSRKFMHRDLKPQNVLLTHGGKRALLADFGVCGKVEHTEDLKRSIVGTPAFMSPEMLQGRPYGFKTDQWALGCVLFETMALEPPFAGRCDSYAAVVHVVLHSKPLPAPPGYSLELSHAVEALLARKPHDRPSNRELLRGSLLREPFHTFIRSLDHRRTFQSTESPVPAPSASPSSTPGSWYDHVGPRRSTGPGMGLPHLNGSGPSGGALASIDGFSAYVDPGSRPDTGATTVLSAALLVKGTQLSSSSHSSLPTSLPTPAKPSRCLDIGRHCPELPPCVPSEMSSKSPSGTRGGSLAGSHLSRSIGISGGSGGSGGCGSAASSSVLDRDRRSGGRSDGRSGSGSGGNKTSSLTLAGNGSLGWQPSPGFCGRGPQGGIASHTATGGGSGGGSCFLPPLMDTRLGGGIGGGMPTVLPRVEPLEPDDCYDSDEFDSYSGHSPASQRPRSGRSGGPVIPGATQDWMSELNSSCGSVLGEPLDIHGSSLDDVVLGREEWGTLLEEAESMLRPETPEEAGLECWKLRTAVVDALGGVARLEQALVFLRNRRPLGETMEADELMLQVELGDLLGDDGLQVLPYLERIVELEGATYSINSARE